MVGAGTEGVEFPAASAVAVGQVLCQAAWRRDLNRYACVHLGVVETTLAGAAAVLGEAAAAE